MALKDPSVPRADELVRMGREVIAGQDGPVVHADFAPDFVFPRPPGDLGYPRQKALADRTFKPARSYRTSSRTMATFGMPASDSSARTESGWRTAGMLAREAEQIDVDRRGRRLSEDRLPEEIAPLVLAVNAALERLDEGYERQRRFIASAAHELRTPIAILRAKVEAAQEPGPRRLGVDVDRLGALAEQLLDFQRLDSERALEPLDLPALVRRVAADLAPLLIASDCTIEVSVERVAPLRGDEAAIARALTNLVHNAIEHGGRHVIVRVLGASFEVEDDGPGIPEKERERVFEPFRRLRPGSGGAGLGLHLVQQVVERHSGQVSIAEAPGGGALVRVVLPSG